MTAACQQRLACRGALPYPVRMPHHQRQPACRCLLAALLPLLAAAGPADAPARVKRILIVGDSWAMSITRENVDQFPTEDVFDDVLAASGLGAFETEGATTAWGGRTAAGWARPEMLARIDQALAAHPGIDCVHLIIGGNDFLSAVERPGFAGLSPEERAHEWTTIGGHVERIVRHLLAARTGLRVVLAGYDFLDFDKAAAFWKKYFHGVDGATLNRWLVEHGQALRAVAERNPGCHYVQNFGTLQHAFGSPPGAVPLPGQAPDYEPFPGGDPALGMPDAISPDGIHPNAEAHARLLRNAVDRYYRAWLAPEGAAASPAR